MKLWIGMKRNWLGLFSIFLCLLFMGSLAAVTHAAPPGGNKLTATRVSGTVLGIGPESTLWNGPNAITYGMRWVDDVEGIDPGISKLDVVVKAIHNGTDIAFRMSWADSTANTMVFQPVDFGDRASIMHNANRLCQMGSPNNPVNLWFWNAAVSAPAENIISGGLGTITHTVGDDNIQVTSDHTGSHWEVVMSRPMAPIDPDDQYEFTAGDSGLPVAFAVWDGHYQERNGSKWISGIEQYDIDP